MSAQVIFAVNHAYLDLLTPACFDWLGFQASVHRELPITWTESHWDSQGRSFRRAEVPPTRPILSFSYSEYGAKSLYLIGHDLLVDIPSLYDVDVAKVDGFSGFASSVARLARYRKYPFYEANVVFKKADAPALRPGKAPITIFSYDTDSFAWKDTPEVRRNLAAIANYCATGRHDGAFGRIDSESGHFGKSFRPLLTLQPEQRALLHIYEGLHTAIVMPQRDMVLSPVSEQARMGSNEIITALMRSEGYELSAVRQLSQAPGRHS